MLNYTIFNPTLIKKAVKQRVKVQYINQKKWQKAELNDSLLKQYHQGEIKQIIPDIDQDIKAHFGSKKSFCQSIDEDPTNFSKRYVRLLTLLNSWLKPLNIILVPKKIN